ncbi:MAG TPA: hypothetical protein VF986_07710 [Actinomycetota bacterium]
MATSRERSERGDDPRTLARFLDVLKTGNDPMQAEHMNEALPVCFFTRPSCSDHAPGTRCAGSGRHQPDAAGPGELPELWSRHDLLERDTIEENEDDYSLVLRRTGERDCRSRR